MSKVDVRPVHAVADRADYLECGVGKDKKMHEAAGTDRLAVMYCDSGSIDAFVAHGEALAERHGRTVQAHSYLQSFHPDEFDVGNHEDLQRVNDLGFMLAKKMHPNSDALVVTHDDSEGKNAHNHILVLNHDNETGRALTKYRTFGSVRKVNDQLMHEQGQEILTERLREKSKDLALAGRLEQSIRPGQESYWAAKRADPSSKYFTEAEFDPKTAFTVRLGDAVASTMLDPEVTSQQELIEALGKIEVEGAPDAKRDGVQMIIDPEHGGVRLKMWHSEAGRLSRRKASGLSDQFTTKGQEQFFAEKAADLERERKIRDQQIPAGAGRDLTPEPTKSFREMAAEIEASTPTVDMSWLDEYRAEQGTTRPGPTPPAGRRTTSAPTSPRRPTDTGAGDPNPEMPTMDMVGTPPAREVPMPVPMVPVAKHGVSDEQVEKNVEQPEVVEHEGTASEQHEALEQTSESEVDGAGEQEVEQEPAFRSALHDQRSKGSKMQERIDGLAEFEDRWHDRMPATPEERERFEQEIKDVGGVGRTFLNNYGEHLDPQLRGPLLAREQMRDRARRHYDEAAAACEKFDERKQDNARNGWSSERDPELANLRESVEKSNREQMTVRAEVKAGDYLLSPAQLQTKREASLEAVRKKHGLGSKTFNGPSADQVNTEFRSAADRSDGGRSL